MKWKRVDARMFSKAEQERFTSCTHPASIHANMGNVSLAQPGCVQPTSPSHLWRNSSVTRMGCQSHVHHLSHKTHQESLQR